MGPIRIPGRWRLSTPNPFGLFERRAQPDVGLRHPRLSFNITACPFAINSSAIAPSRIAPSRSDIASRISEWYSPAIMGTSTTYHLASSRSIADAASRNIGIRVLAVLASSPNANTAPVVPEVCSNMAASASAIVREWRANIGSVVSKYASSTELPHAAISTTKIRTINRQDDCLSISAVSPRPLGRISLFIPKCYLYDPLRDKSPRWNRDGAMACSVRTHG